LFFVFADIVMKSCFNNFTIPPSPQLELEEKQKAIDDALRANIQRITDGLDAHVVAEKKKHVRRRKQHARDVDEVYSDLLQQFLAVSKVGSYVLTCEKFKITFFYNFPSPIIVFRLVHRKLVPVLSKNITRWIEKGPPQRLVQVWVPMCPFLHNRHPPRQLLYRGRYAFILSF
jgi:hypothetical protein